MYAKTCPGCSKQFEAQKISRKWCSDTCSRRSRRRGVVVPNHTVHPVIPVAIPVVSSDTSVSDADNLAYLRSQLSFARAVAPTLVLPLDLVEALLSLDDEARVPEEADYLVVERALVARAVTRLLDFQSGSAAVDDVQADLALLAELWDDRVDDRVISALAASL